VFAEIVGAILEVLGTFWSVSGRCSSSFASVFRYFCFHDSAAAVSCCSLWVPVFLGPLYLFFCCHICTSCISFGLLIYKLINKKNGIN